MVWSVPMIGRPERLAELRAALRRSRIAALLGPRQSGKTTLARQLLSPDSERYFDLENPRSLARLSEPMTALESLRGLVVIDEVQRRPELFPVLRVLADRRPIRARFLILGSASPPLLQQASESLAGRLETLTLSGFSLAEVGASALRRHWRRGGFPLSFTARSEHASFVWREQFARTFMERDLPPLGIQIPPATLHRFWTMLAHYHGGLWNAAEAARSLSSTEPTARRYLDLLSGLFLVRQLQPWHANLKKRQVKAPKVYVRDSGILHALVGIASERELLSHPKLGASFEGYVIEEVLKTLRPDAAYFWATHQGAELDLLLVKGGRRFGVEVKYQDAPRLTASMRSSLAELGLERLTVLYPGSERYTLADRVSVMPIAELPSRGATLMAPAKLARKGRA